MKTISTNVFVKRVQKNGGYSVRLSFHQSVCCNETEQRRILWNASGMSRSEHRLKASLAVLISSLNSKEPGKWTSESDGKSVDDAFMKDTLSRMTCRGYRKDESTARRVASFGRSTP